MTEAPALTVPQVAERLACSTDVIYAMIRAGEIGCIKRTVSGSSLIRITREQLQDWIDQHTCPATQTLPISSDAPAAESGTSPTEAASSARVRNRARQRKGSSTPTPKIGTSHSARP